MTPLVINRNSAESSSKQIARKIGKMILQGDLAAKSRLPNHARLASMLGVSGNTVQNAMDELVSRGLVSRKRGLGTFVAAVPKAAKGKLGLVFWHQPDTEADHEWGRPSPEWGYFRAALEQSIRLRLQLVVDSWEHLERENGNHDLVQQFATDTAYEAILFFNTRFRDLPGIEELAKRRSGVALINAVAGTQGASCINVDYRPAAQEAAKELKQLGHSRVILLGGAEEQFLVSKSMTVAFGQAVSDVGLEAVLVSSAEELSGCLAEPGRPTAIWLAGSTQALRRQYPKVLKKKGLQVPEQLSLIGLAEDRLEAPADSGNAIARIDEPPELLVRVGIQAMIAADGAPVRLSLPAEFVAGDSLAQAPPTD